MTWRAPVSTGRTRGPRVRRRLAKVSDHRMQGTASMVVETFTSATARVYTIELSLMVPRLLRDHRYLAVEIPSRSRRHPREPSRAVRNVPERPRRRRRHGGQARVHQTLAKPSRGAPDEESFVPQESMTPRERWMAVLSLKQPDRVPMDIWLTPKRALCAHLGCDFDTAGTPPHRHRSRRGPYVRRTPEGQDIWGLVRRVDTARACTTSRQRRSRGSRPWTRSGTLRLAPPRLVGLRPSARAPARNEHRPCAAAARTVSALQTASRRSTGPSTCSCAPTSSSTASTSSSSWPTRTPAHLRNHSGDGRDHLCRRRPRRADRPPHDPRTHAGIPVSP